MKCGIFFGVCFLLGNLSTSFGGVPTDLTKLQEGGLSQLLTAALENENVLEEARIIYKWKYGDHLVDISYVSKDINEIYVSENVIAISPELAENFLKVFGQSISKLAVSFNFIHTKQKYIGKLVNQYCSESLIEFQSKHCREGAYDDMKKPFVKVEKVVFIGTWKNLTHESCTLDKLFPKMRVLNLSVTESHILDGHYPHLIELNADVDPSSSFIKFFEKNTQIKILRLESSTSMELIDTVNEKLSDLEFLEFRIPQDMPTYEGPEIRMSKVKNVTIRDTQNKFLPGKISFKKLDQMRLSVFGHINAEWTEFIVANKNLKSLTMVIWNVNNTALLELSDKLNDLVEANFNVDNNIEIDNIAKFLESNKHMKTLNLNFPIGSIIFLDELAEKLKENWKITPTNKYFNAITITRLPNDKSSASSLLSSAILLTLIVANLFLV